MKRNLTAVKLLAPDLRPGKLFPRSPRETCGGYVLAARALDKCRALLAGCLGEYHSNCPLDQRWLKFAEIEYLDFKAFVATGAPDPKVATWIKRHARQRPPREIILWNNRERDLRVSDLAPELQVYLEEYIQKNIPRNRVVYHWYDVYDLEEHRL